MSLGSRVTNKLHTLYTLTEAGIVRPTRPDRLLALAQEAVDQRWATYEEMATRGPARFASDARRS